MAEPETPPPPPEGETAESPRPPKPKTRWWHHWKMILSVMIATPIVALCIYTALALNWSYSQGDRAGILQKFSHKGWLCKTWEGTLLLPTPPGVAPVTWDFTVRSDSVAHLVNDMLGKQVVLSYQEHRGVPTDCFGDTQYFITGIRPE
jgi:hypothetical protein